MSEFQDKKAVICFFIAESVVLFASKESDSNRSELTKQVTAAQLAIAFRQSLQARPTTSERRALIGLIVKGLTVKVGAE